MTAPTPPAFTLYGEPLWISPYVFSSFVALREKNATFSVRPVPIFDGAQHEASYAEPSVTARVPSLEVPGTAPFRLAESSAIAEYLEDLLPTGEHQRLFPLNLEARARARQVMAWFRSELGALREERSTIGMFYPLKVPPLTAAGKRDLTKLVRVADQLVPRDGGPLFGEWSLVDAELAFMLHRLLLVGDALPTRLADYARAQWARPSVQAFVTHERPAEIPASYWAYAGVAALPIR